MAVARRNPAAAVVKLRGFFPYKKRRGRRCRRRAVNGRLCGLDSYFSCKLPVTPSRLPTEIDGQGQIGGRCQGEAQLAHTGAAAQIRGIDVEAIGGGSRRAVEFVFPDRADVGSDVFVDRIGEAPAETQTAGVRVLEAQVFARGQPYAVAFLPGPEVSTVEVQTGRLVDVPRKAVRRVCAEAGRCM